MDNKLFQENEQVRYEGDNTRSEDSNYVGDDMEGDVIEQYNGDKSSKHLSSSNSNIRTSSKGDDFAEMKSLREYQGYPNEAQEINKLSSMKRITRKEYPSLRTMKDAIAVDNSLIDSELKALDVEDLKIGKNKKD